MDRDTAIKLDGYLTGIRASLNGAAHLMEAALAPAEFKSLIRYIGEAMGGTIEISNQLYRSFPDITPPELVSGSPPSAAP